MNIGVDIDGVLTNDDDFILAYATKYCIENNAGRLKYPNAFETRKYDWSNIIFNDYINKYFWTYCKKERPRHHCGEVLNKLKEEGHKIYIITSRYTSYYQSEEGEKMRRTIKKWLKKFKIPYDGLYFSQNKVVQIQELKLDIMIEDSPQTIPVFKDYVDVFCFDCRYNQDINYPNVTRVYSWYDIYDKIHQREKTKQD